MRIEKKYLYAYNEFFYRARRSQAHARFCERVYGRDLCQHGMADMRQIDDLVDCMKADGVQKALELGCGNGAITAYIAAGVNAAVTGVDIAEEGIRWAQESTVQSPGKLTFHTADMAAMDDPSSSFDAILLIDAIYFVKDLLPFLQRMLSWLSPGGRLYIYYSAWVDDASQRYRLSPDATPLAQALTALSLAYDTRDYSAAEAAHWRIKRQAAEEMQPEFEAEGNGWLQHRRWIEADCHRLYIENNNVSRYLYRINQPT